MPRLTIIDLPPDIPTYHWKADKPDNRDYKYSVSKVKQPNIVDLRPWCTKIEDQGRLGSCTGNAIASAIELLYKINRKEEDLSRLFIYYYERLLLGTVNYDSGAYIRDGIKACAKWGASLERLWPYNISRFREAPDKIALDDGLKRKITRYERVNNHAGCLDAIANGYPVIIGFSVYSSFDSLQVYTKGQMPFPDVKRERFLGGHAVLLVGYDKTKQVYIVKNSWGTRWGDRGFFYMPFKVIETPSMSGDFWVIKSTNIPR